MLYFLNHPDCDNCEIEYEQFCPRCGMLGHVKDTKVRKGVKDRAKKTIPAEILTVKPSAIHGSGVFATKLLPQGLKFGPFEGIEMVNSSKGCAWKLKSGCSIEATNWMKYVKCSKTNSQYNMICYER